jgi:hypothetical protein
VFTKSITQNEVNIADTNLQELFKEATIQLKTNDGKLFQTELFKEKSDRPLTKFTGRMNRIRTAFARGEAEGPMPSAYGERGIY